MARVSNRFRNKMIFKSIFTLVSIEIIPVIVPTLEMKSPTKDFGTYSIKSPFINPIKLSTLVSPICQQADQEKHVKLVSRQGVLKANPFTSAASRLIHNL